MHKTYDVAAYIWPSYHPDPRAKIFWPAGIGEWETVLSTKAKFQGHEQPRFPLWGCVNEADPLVMEMQINAAADHGVNVFIYDWYWYDGMPFLEGCLNDGYLKARNNGRVKFCIMWANHDVGNLWDKRNAGLKNDTLLWKGAMDREEFEVIGRRMLAKYFRHPSYYKIEGKPVFIIYDPTMMVRGLGGVKKTREALDWFRKETAKAGLKGLNIQLILRRPKYMITDAAGKKICTQQELAEKLGLDAVTHYQNCATNVDIDYRDVVKNFDKEAARIEKEFPVPYYSHVSVGWDNNSRHKMFIPGITKNSNPANFEKALRKAKAFVDARPKQAPFITVNSWNEWTEASYLQPCTMHGYGYLEAVKRVFGGK